MKREPKRDSVKDEEAILSQAATYCLRHFPMLWTIGGIREESEGGSRRWVIAVYLRYPTGHEGYLGDLVYDGRQFTERTERAVMKRRAKEIANDPQRARKWNEFRTPPLPAGEG